MASAHQSPAEANEQPDSIREAAVMSQEKALVPLIEDIAEWVTRVTGLTVNPSSEGFLDSLDTGVTLCKLIEVIQEKQASGTKEKIKYKQGITKGGWHARDNAATFILWCKRFKVKDEALFESDDLVSHKQKRQIVLCLIELARFAARYGIEPPAIVKLEKEIEKDEMLLNRLQSTKGDVKKALATNNKKGKLSDLDMEIRALTGQCKCEPEFYVDKLTDGIYTLGNKRCLIRKLKDKHIMVRVGGGWDTLENYLSCHDPCRISLFRKVANQEDFISASDSNGLLTKAGADNSESRFVHIKGKYNRAGEK